MSDLCSKTACSSRKTYEPSLPQEQPAECISVACVWPRTSKGIKDLLLPLSFHRPADKVRTKLGSARHIGPSVLRKFTRKGRQKIKFRSILVVLFIKKLEKKIVHESRTNHVYSDHHDRGIRSRSAQPKQDILLLYFACGWIIV
jgi:hypothetical protein